MKSSRKRIGWKLGELTGVIRSRQAILARRSARRVIMRFGDELSVVLREEISDGVAPPWLGLKTISAKPCVDVHVRRTAVMPLRSIHDTNGSTLAVTSGYMS